MPELLQDTAARAARYLEGLPNRSVVPSSEDLSQLASLNGALPEEPSSAEAVIELLDKVGSPATIGTAGGRYFGFVIGGSLPAALGANWLAGAWDQNAFSTVTSPVAAALEDIALRWLLEVLNLPADCSGAFATGATMANFTALAAARQAVLETEGWDVTRQGLCGAPPLTVIVGEEVHPTVLKGLGLLGLGRDRIVTVPTDGQGRMRADALPALSGPAIVCIQAGNVNTGAFDPAEAICTWAHDAGAWVHVDGAFGLWAATAPERAHLMMGFADADSWATDAHKWLNVPTTAGSPSSVMVLPCTKRCRSVLPIYPQKEPPEIPMTSLRRPREEREVLKYGQPCDRLGVPDWPTSLSEPVAMQNASLMALIRLDLKSSIT